MKWKILFSKIGEFPHQLYLEKKVGSGYSFACGAVLVSRHQAFIAAHCVEEKRKKLLF